MNKGARTIEKSIQIIIVQLGEFQEVFACLRTLLNLQVDDEVT